MSKLTVIKPPHSIGVLPETTTSVFLAGSIEMGKAVDWQLQIATALEDYDHEYTLFNPRRDDWNSSWEQTIENDEFRGQVEWELDALEKADFIIFYFDKDTISPITLMELGLYARTQKIVVCCPDGYFRKGNVEVLCAKYDIALVNTLDELIEVTKLLHYGKV